MDPRSRQAIGRIALDEEINDPVSVLLIHCLLCTVGEKYDKWQLTCLGLCPTDRTLEEFVRVGLASIQDSSWFGDLDDGFGGQSSRKDTQLVRTVRVVWFARLT